MHVFDADGAAIRITQHTEQITERHLGGTCHTTSEELAVEIPDGQSVRDGVELDRKLGLFPAQGINVGDEVSANTMNADERGDLHLLVQHRLFAVHRVDIDTPLHRFVRNTEAAEDRLVEAVFSEQQLVHPLQEQTTLGALNDAVVVGGGDGDDLGNTQRGQGSLVGPLELCRIIDRADTNDDALTGHQPRHALYRTDGARVGEADGRALEVGDLKFVLLDLANQILVRHHEVGERQRVGVAQHGHDQITTAIGLGHVDGETHAHVGVAHDARLAVGAFEVGVVHLRNRVGDGSHDGVPDDVREAHLALAGTTAIAVDHRSIHFQQLRGDVAETGGGRNRETALHVGHDRDTSTLDRLTRLAARHGCGRRRRCRGRRRGRTAVGRGLRDDLDNGTRRSRTGGDRLVVREKLAP